MTYVSFTAGYGLYRRNIAKSVSRTRCWSRVIGRYSFIQGDTSGPGYFFHSSDLSASDGYHSIRKSQRSSFRTKAVASCGEIEASFWDFSCWYLRFGRLLGSLQTRSKTIVRTRCVSGTRGVTREATRLKRLCTINNQDSAKRCDTRSSLRRLVNHWLDALKRYVAWRRGFILIGIL